MDLSSLEEKKSFREHTKGMDKRKLWEYIWMYYKVPIIVGLAVLLMGISITTSIIHNRNEMKKVQLMVLDVASVQAKALWEEEASLISTPYLAAGADVNWMVAARITANELDVSLVPKDHVQWIQAQEGLIPLDDLLQLPGDEVEKIVDEQTGQVVAVCINQTPFYRQVEASVDYVDDLYLCISARDERQPQAVAFAQKILDSIVVE